MHTSRVAQYIAAAIDRCGKSQLQISEEAGFSKANVITMIKQGKTKLPLDRIEGFSQALGVDPYELLDLVMSEYFPDHWVFIRKTLSSQPTALWAIGNGLQRQ